MGMISSPAWRLMGAAMLRLKRMGRDIRRTTCTESSPGMGCKCFSPSMFSADASREMMNNLPMAPLCSVVVFPLLTLISPTVQDSVVTVHGAKAHRAAETVGARRSGGVGAVSETRGKGLVWGQVVYGY